MKSLEMAFLLITGAIVVVACAVWIKRAVGSASLRTGQQRLKGFSVYDLQVSVGGGAERPKREASLYLTLKSSPGESHSAAKLLFEEKVRRLGE